MAMASMFPLLLGSGQTNQATNRFDLSGARMEPGDRDIAPVGSDDEAETTSKSQLI